MIRRYEAKPHRFESTLRRDCDSARNHHSGEYVARSGIPRVRRARLSASSS